jgi:hypothetical protein
LNSNPPNRMATIEYSTISMKNNWKIPFLSLGINGREKQTLLMYYQSNDEI